MKFAASILNRLTAAPAQEQDVFGQRLENMVKPQPPHARHRKTEKPVLFGFRKDQAA